MLVTTDGIMYIEPKEDYPKVDPIPFNYTDSRTIRARGVLQFLIPDQFLPILECLPMRRVGFHSCCLQNNCGVQYSLYIFFSPSLSPSLSLLLSQTLFTATIYCCFTMIIHQYSPDILSSSTFHFPPLLSFFPSLTLSSPLLSSPLLTISFPPLH